MITEDYVSFETARLLKEKGFDEPCNMGYDEKEQLIPLANWRNTALDKFEGVSAKVTVPTLQTAMKWLREIYKIFISIQQHMNMSYVWYIYEDGTWKGCDRESHNSTYEQSCEAAIKYCLENLI